MDKTTWMKDKDCTPLEYNRDLQTLETYEHDLVRILDEYSVMDGYRDYLLLELAKARKEIRERGKGDPLV